MPNCPDCDFSHENNGTVFTHRIKNHTDSGEGDSFNLYDDEIFPIYVDMATHQAKENADSDYDEVTEEELVDELAKLGVSVGVKESLDDNTKKFSEDVRL